MKIRAAVAVSSPPAPPRSRFVSADGVQNLRDLGGYPTVDGGTLRWGMLYRGPALGTLTGRGSADLCALGLRTVIDLRDPHEREHLPDPVLGAGVTTVTIPIYDGRIDLGTMDDLGQLFTELLRVAGREIVHVLDAIAAAEALPAVVHCSAGKDRTGLVVALLLAALGVPDEVIAADFALTAEALTGPYLDEVVARGIASGLDPVRIQSLIASPPELVLDFLTAVRTTHGSAARYLCAHGTTTRTLGELRQRLVTGRVC
jgi:protein-tyrosine phosphatase